MFEDDFDCMIKIVLLGDASVGKSNILLRYVKNDFHTGTKPTIGTDFYSKLINKNDMKIKI